MGDVEATVNSVVAEHRKAQSMPSNSAMRIETCRIKQTAVYIGQVYPVGDTSADDTSSSAVAFTPEFCEQFGLIANVEREPLQIPCSREQQYLHAPCADEKKFKNL